MAAVYQTLPDVPPSVAGRLTSQLEVRETRFGSGYVHRRLARLGGPVRHWQLVWRDLESSDLNRLDLFFTAHRGLTPFYWTPPGLPGTGLYICQRWQVTPRTGLRADLSARFTSELATNQGGQT